MIMLCCLFCKGQEVNCKIVDLKKEQLNTHFNAYNLELNKYNYIRFRWYNNENYQITYIYKKKRIELRLYAYFNWVDLRISPAISFRMGI